jgi:hypothetical protein
MGEARATFEVHGIEPGPPNRALYLFGPSMLRPPPNILFSSLKSRNDMANLEICHVMDTRQRQLKKFL